MRTLQQEIITELKVQPTIDPEVEIRRSIDFIKAYLCKHPFLKTLVLGISRGPRFNVMWQVMSNGDH